MALVVHYLLNDNAANTTVADAMSAQNGTATANTSSLTAAGRINQGFLFNASSYMVDCTNNAIFTLSNYTMMCWYKKNGHAAASQHLCGRFDSGNSNGYRIRITTAGKVSIAHAVNAPVTYDSIDGLADLDDNAWHHVAMKFTVGVGLEGYVDGTSIGTDNTTTLAHGATTLKFTIGAQDYAASRNWCAGTLDDVRLYNTALSTADIALVYNSGSGTEDNYPVAGMAGAMTTMKGIW